ncbi:hypothetical protein C8J56DRAFT_1170076 [Mycena floridula]|nr:hypothetical protein C8J56DRAFT_1170076 [Mycena floridula]
MATSGSQMHNTVENSSFGNIGGNVNSHNTINHNYPVAKGPTHRARGYMPAANNKLFGRDQEIEEIVHALTMEPASNSKRVRFALLGAGGQGKTELALKVMAHPAMKQCYSKKNGIWAPCEKASSPELLLDVLFTSLAIIKDTHNTIQDILDELEESSEPIILLLDNFETPWNASGARGEVEQILQDIAQLPHVALFITMRATVPPCEDIDWEEMRIQPLDPDSAYQLFVTIDKRAKEEVKVRKLLEMLGYMALAVKLMARHAKNTGFTVGQLISNYEDTSTAMTMLGSAQGSDRQNSVSVSICMSLESALVKNELNAALLLQIIAMLPSGTSPETLQQWWAQNLANLNGALRVLLESSLLEQRTTTYFVLPVIRSYLLDPSHFSANIHDSMVNVACNFLDHYDSTEPGEESFQDHMDARAIEEINLQSILLQTSESNVDVINALHTLAWHQYRVRPRTEVIQHAVKLLQNVTDPNPLVGHVYDCYASILYTLGQYQESLKQYNLARDAYLAASRPTDGAWALIDIADVSALIDSSFNEIPLLEQAQQELNSLDEDGEDWKKAMACCLKFLGEAHSRWSNHSEALEHLTRARDFCSDLPFERAQCADKLAEAHHRLQQFDEAEKWAVLAVSEWKQIGGYLGRSLWVLGRVYISKAEYDKAIRPLEEGLQHAKAYGDQQDTASILLELGRAHMKKGKNNDAKKLFSQALMNHGNLEGVEDRKIICQYYLNKLDDPSRVPTSEEEDALAGTDHEEDIPGHGTVLSSAV